MTRHALHDRPPRVSILLPCRDAAAFLPEAIASIRAQTFSDYEVVAVDDGSTDDTAALLHEWQCHDARVTIHAQPPSGIVHALRTAVEHARGEVFVRMDADDVAHPERIARQIALLDAHAGIEVCGTLVRYFPRSAVRAGAERYEAWINALVTHHDIVHDVFVECPIAHPTLAVRRAALERAGGYRDSAGPEDYDLVLRLWRSGARFGKVPIVLHRWRERPDRASRTDPRYDEAAFRRCKVEHLRATLLAAADAVVIWGAGPVGKAFARDLIAAGTEVRAFVDVDPRKLGQTVHGAPVISLDDPRAAPVPGAVSLAAVAGGVARGEIRASAAALGWRDGVDLIAVA